MNKVGRILLLVGGLVLALLIGVLIGRGQRIEPTSEGAASAVQITTAPPPTIAPTPLPAPVQPPPQPAAAPRPAPDLQVQEDAAAVGMTTREPPGPATSDDQPAPTAPRSAAAAPAGVGDEAPPPPKG